MNIIKKNLINELKPNEKIYTYRFCLRQMLDLLDEYEDCKYSVQMVSKSYCCYGEQIMCWNDLHFDIPCTKNELYDNYDWLRLYFKQWSKYLKGKKIYMIKKEKEYGDELNDLRIVVPLRDQVKEDYYISIRKSVVDYQVLRTGKIVEIID